MHFPKNSDLNRKVHLKKMYQARLNEWAYLLNAPVSREAFIRLHEIFI